MSNDSGSQASTMGGQQIDGSGHHAPLEFLSFTLGNEEYGIDIQRVQELRGYEAVTRIANAPDFMKGVMNLRGVIVPIIDLRMKFALGVADYDQFTVVVILNISGQTIGIVVDSVSDVITLTQDQIKPTPEIGSTIEADFLIGLAPLEERMLILMDIQKLMSSDDMGLQFAVTM
ncbi:chemotaxis protein CheW [Undibacterium jejuense]|uniref:Chemotaxis protein CheW n=2 Tax=Undibacterium jejuense TaxID=1344949 RepID=A0A923HHB3_9BURK|nr:chemotaxis protein CheW [Undibacterium jejuense]